LKNLALIAKFCLLSTGTEEGLLGGLDAASSRISINNHKCLPKWLLQPILQISKEKRSRAVVAEGYPGAVVMLPQLLTGPLSRAAPEKYADSSAHIAHHHLCGTSESRACIVSV
jgi:hypothetical protein